MYPNTIILKKVIRIKKILLMVVVHEISPYPIVNIIVEAKYIMATYFYQRVKSSNLLFKASEESNFEIP